MNYLKLLLFVGAFFASYSLLAQPKIETKIDLEATEWTLLKVQDSIKIEYKFIECSDPASGTYDKMKLILKCTNGCSSEVKVSWHALKEFNGDCQSCLYPEEYSFSFVLAPYDIVQGDCSSKLGNALAYFSKFSDTRYHGDKVEMTGFDLVNLKITKTEIK